VSFVSENSRSGVVLAFSILSSIWISSFLFNSYSGSIIHTSFFITSIATITSILSAGTINQLLLRKRPQCLCFQKCKPFKWSSSRKSPAWSAISLVLNWSHCTICNPVHWWWKFTVSIKVLNIFWILCFALGSLTCCESCLIFRFSQICKWTCMHLESVFRVCVEFFSPVEGSRPNLVSSFRFSIRNVELVIVWGPLLEHFSFVKVKHCWDSWRRGGSEGG